MAEAPVEKKSKKYEDYEIEGWVSTLASAEEIKADAEKMKLLQPYLDKKVKAYSKIRSLSDLKDVAAKKKMYSREDA